jgi:DNA helicase-2/ATP-dependent DNA helicase PcrA
MSTPDVLAPCRSTLPARPEYAGLNPEQQRAIACTEGPLLVLAGAGSGKTRVLTTRIAHLVDDLDVDPSTVLAITFTRKAAMEMKARVAKILGRERAEPITLTTFHALGVLLLREYHSAAGLSSRFTVGDEADQGARVRTQLRRQQVARNAEGERPREVMERIALAKTHIAALVVRMVEEDPTTADKLLARYRAGDPTLLDGLQRITKAPDPDRFARTFQGYQESLAADQMVDYEDLLVLPLLLLLQRTDVRQRCTARWQYLLVDEYQDTDFVQDHLLRLLAGESRNLCVVGDDEQAIYSWRGAKVENIRTFADRFAPCTVVTLDQNYRSTPVILEAANALLASRPEPGRMARRLRTDSTVGELVRCWTAVSQEAEAEAVVNDIETARRAGAIRDYADVMVLFRKNALGRTIEAAFRRGGLPYRIINGASLHERVHVRDLLAWCRLAVNPHDSVSFERAVTSPSRGVGLATIEALASVSRVEGISIVAAAERAAEWGGIRPAAAKSLVTFAGMVRTLADVANQHGSAVALQDLIEITGVRQRLIQTLAEHEMDDDDDAAVDAQRCLDDLDDFVRYVEEFCRSRVQEAHEDGPDRAMDVADFAIVPLDTVLDELATLTPLSEGLAHGPVAGAAALGAVSLMSVHAAKGLEAARVYVVGCEEKVFPVHARPDVAAAPGGTTEGAVRAAEDAQMAEEGRLFYVAITRARDTLILSASRTRELDRGDARPMVRSRFLAALPETIYRPESIR